MSSNERRQLLEQLQSKEFRDALVEADITNGILFQLQAMLEERGWNQDELADRASTSQPVVSKYMRGYENFSVKTLKRLASAFDVSLTVHFERFSELLNRNLSLDETYLKIPSFSEDDDIYRPVSEYTRVSAADAEFDLDFACVAPGSHETLPVKIRASQQEGEKAYARTA